MRNMSTVVSVSLKWEELCRVAHCIDCSYSLVSSLQCCRFRTAHLVSRCQRYKKFLLIVLKYIILFY